MSHRSISQFIYSHHYHNGVLLSTVRGFSVRRYHLSPLRMQCRGLITTANACALVFHLDYLL